MNSTEGMRSSREGWIDERIIDLDALLRANDYRGHDPFDLTNSPLFRLVPKRWFTPQLLFSKLGSRVRFAWLRWLFRVPRIADPKTYACAYFGYRVSNDENHRRLADLMLERLVFMAGREADGAHWGYDYTWPTRSDGIHERRGSTVVPGSFAIFALVHDAVTTGSDRHLSTIYDACRYYAVRHLREGPSGPFIGYFPQSRHNTHNANLLGSAALSLGGFLFGRSDWSRIAAEAVATSLKAVRADGYIPYNDHASGEWSDAFHHLYVIAALDLIAEVNAEVDASHLRSVSSRMREHYSATYKRDDGSINYYPGQLYPIDPHNYAAASIFTAIAEDDPSQASELLERIDNLAWDEQRGRYIHRKHRLGTDRRFFLRWGHAWMFAALSTVRFSDEFNRQLSLYQNYARDPLFAGWHPGRIPETTEG